jgi:predicted 3-demethylubiquinone-9 3-methyltransferase (glyoxalase superfamily)
MQKIQTFLWFKDEAAEAAAYYVKVFKHSKILKTLLTGPDGPGPKGSVLLVSFQLEDQVITALNGNPDFPFTLATSLLVNCETQEEIDHYWDTLSEGGEKLDCGWLTDKYGVAWQIVPSKLSEYIQDDDREKARRVFAAMLTMKKLDLRKLQETYEEGV